jgi:hypothetical protein
MTQFKTLAEVMKFYEREDNCRDIIEKNRWPDGNIICPKCSGGKCYRMGDMKHYKCRDKKCGTRFSVIKGTVFEGTKLPLAKWFTAMYLVMAHKKGVSSHQIARNLGIGQKAAWFLLCRIREIMRSKSFEMLDNIVEVDETYVGGKWENMSKDKRAKVRAEGKDTKTPVMGLIERDGKARLSVIGKLTFKDLVRQNVEPDAMIVTDSHSGYTGLAFEFAGHAVVNHSQQQFKDGIFNTNSVEGAFSHFKRMLIGTYHSVSPKHLHRYCSEFEHRWNTRKVKDVERFCNALKQTEGRLKWKDLIAGKPGRPPKPNYNGIDFISGENG